MLLAIVLTGAFAATDPGATRVSDAFLGSEGGVCLATGYCATPGPGRGGAPPGLMFLAFGLVGTGIMVLRSASVSVGVRPKPPSPSP
jgi:hypothetical protein